MIDKQEIQSMDFSRPSQFSLGKEIANESVNRAKLT
jgi:hypothetical protein